MLFYLARRSDWISRAELAFLYRPDVPEELALSNVRTFIHRVRERAWTEGLEVEKFRVRFKVESDVQAFEQALANQDWAAALALYRGPFAQGLTLGDVPGYEAWLELERQNLNHKWRLAALNQSKHLEEQGDFDGAEGWLLQLLTSDPLDEEALQVYLRVLHKAGKRNQVREVYERFRAELKRELDIEPLETTRALLESLGQGEAPAQSTKKLLHNLPAQTTRFVGRNRELAQLSAHLKNPECRLLTLMGLGGIGKTRLALELVGQNHEPFPQGVWFVPLAGINSPDLLVSSIATAVGLNLSGTGDPKTQLINFLREKELLLLLDNFEHLVEGALLVEELLEAAPRLKVLATSRVALELKGEWLFDLEGLVYPPVHTEEALDGFDAVKLFIVRAQRLSANFVLSQDTLTTIAALTRKVEGMPLALELAATWVRTLSTEELLAVLEKDTDILSTTLRDVPERHRSLRKVFDYSWTRLSKSEQQALAKLSVFQGGFTAGAAEAVAGAHLALLLSLINRSLVRRNAEGRYGLHELVRQYTASQLNEKETKKLQKHYSGYFLELIARQGKGLRGPKHLEVRRGLLEELDNLRSACSVAIAQQDWAALDGAVAGLNVLLREANLLEEARALFEQIASASRKNKRLFARALARQGLFLRHLGRYQESRKVLEQAVGLLRELKLDDDLAAALPVLGTSTRETGQPAEAEAVLMESLALSKGQTDSHPRTETLFTLSQLRRDQGQYDQARELLEECLSLYEQKGDALGIALAMAQLALLVGRFGGDTVAERNYTERSLEVFIQMGDHKNQAIALNNLAVMAHQEGNNPECERLLRESLAIKQHLGDLGGQVLALANLGGIVRGMQRYEDAQGYFEQSLKLARQHGLAAREFYALAEMGETARQKGDFAAAWPYFKAMLQLIDQPNIPPRILMPGLYYLASLYSQTEHHQAAFLLSTFVGNFPGTPKQIEGWAKTLAEQLVSKLEPDIIQHLRDEAKGLSLERLLGRQLELLESINP